MGLGKRSGINGTEIADTIDAIFTYFENTKQNSPALLETIIEEASAWRDKVPALKEADRSTIDNFFGQPAPKDVEALLRSCGITEENSLSGRYRELFNQAYNELTTDNSAYHPGKVVPTLSAYRTILAFDAYRERLDGVEDGAASTLLNRIDAFQGSKGVVHMAGTGLKSLTHDYINNSPRHLSEVYVEPENLYVDYLNAFHHTYTPHIVWKPTDDLQQVTAVVRCGYGGEEKSSTLAHEKAKLDAAFQRGGIDATTEIRLGKTYGEDAIILAMSMEDYTKRYIPISEGKIEIDTTVPGSNHRGLMDAVSIYAGYQSGKSAFREGEDLLVSLQVMNILDSDSMGNFLAGPKEALRFLRETAHIDETLEQVPVSGGKKEDFIRIKPEYPPFDERVYAFEGTYYSCSDMHNKINESLHVINAAINGVAQQPSVVHENTTEDRSSFTHKGDMYLPKGKAFYQIALYAQYTYGVQYTGFIRDKEAAQKAGRDDMYVICTNELKPDIREEAMVDLHQKLKTALQDNAKEQPGKPSTQRTNGFKGPSI